jgi:hypothetical protein
VVVVMVLCMNQIPYCNNQRLKGNRSTSPNHTCLVVYKKYFTWLDYASQKAEVIS